MGIMGNVIVLDGLRPRKQDRVTDRMRGLLLWVYRHPNRQAGDIPSEFGSTKTPERLGLIYWRGCGAGEGWVVTEKGLYHLDHSEAPR